LAFVRLTFEFLAILALSFTLYGVYGEIQEREKDRAVRIATMFVQIAQTLALPDGLGLNAVKSSVELLASESVPMRKINLAGADLSGADLEGADFVNAVLRGANLDGANLENADIRGADLEGAVFSGANLENANVRRANLRQASLNHANLKGAKLGSSNLEGASLVGANLSFASPIDANLSNADISDANLSGTIFFIDIHPYNTDRTGLSQGQLDQACASPDNPPILPEILTWKGLTCR